MEITQIHTTSFGYRLFQFLAHKKNFNPPTKFCPYYRAFLWTFFKRFFQLCGVLILFGAAIYAPTAYFTHNVPDSGRAWPFLPFALGLAEYVAAVVAGLIFAGIAGWVKFKIWYDMRKQLRLAQNRANGNYPVVKPEKPRKVKRPNTLLMYLHALHDKMCPMIEFVPEQPSADNIVVNPDKYPWTKDEDE